MVNLWILHKPVLRSNMACYIKSQIDLFTNWITSLWVNKICHPFRSHEEINSPIKLLSLDIAKAFIANKQDILTHNRWFAEINHSVYFVNYITAVGFPFTHHFVVFHRLWSSKAIPYYCECKTSLKSLIDCSHSNRVSAFQNAGLWVWNLLLFTD